MKCLIWQGANGNSYSALGALIAAVPAAYYMKSGSKPRDGDGSASAEREQTRFSDSTSTTGGSLGQPPSTVDPVRISHISTEQSNTSQANSRKEPGGPSTVSGKQEGISNTTSSNPYMSQPEKSKKGEGETETVKVKGTVSPERPQT